LRVRLAEAGRRVTANDLWIAAIAARDRSLVTLDDDFKPVDGMSGIVVVRV
jgi:predicted nucleic acid-binding protein